MEGTRVNLHSFLVKTQFNIKRAYYTVYGEGPTPLKTIEIDEFYANSVSRVDLENYGNYKIVLTAIDWRDQQIQVSRSFQLVEDTSALAPFVDFRAVQSAANKIYLNLNQSFDFDEYQVIKSFTVNFGDGHVAELTDDTFISHQYARPGTYSVSVTAKTDHGTQKTTSKQVTVTNADIGIISPDATFNYLIYDYAQNVTFYNEKSGTPNGEIISYVWVFGDGAIGYGETQAHFYAPGTYIVSLTVTDSAGLKNTQIQKITVSATGPDIVANIDCDFYAPFVDITQKCRVNALDRHNEISRVRVIWGDGTANNLSNPADPIQGLYYSSKKYTTAGTFPIRLVVNTLRGESRVHDTSLNLAMRYPVASIQCSVNYMLVFCDALASYDPKNLALTYEFDFGNGHVETNATGVISYAYPLAGLYDVKIKVTDSSGLSGMASTAVQAVRPPNVLPVAKFGCNSLEPLALNCWDEGSYDPDGTVAIKKLTFDDGSYEFINSEGYVRHQFATAGEHTVTLSVLDNDGGEATHTASFLVMENTPPIVIGLDCYHPRPLTVDCYANAFDPDSGDFITSYSWDMGDGKTATNTLIPSQISYVYDSSGVKNITITVNDQFGKSATFTKEVMVNANTAPVANFDCYLSVSQTLTCNTYSYDVDNDIVDHQWSIDGIVSYTDKDFVHHFEQGENHEIKLMVRDSFGVENIIVKTFVVPLNKKPIFDIAAQFLTSTIPVKVSFELKNLEDPDGEIDNVKWDFGDGNESSQFIASNVFLQDGVYHVKVTVTDNDGGVVQKSLDVDTRIFENITITPDQEVGIVPLSVNFEASTNDSSEIISTRWLHEGNEVGTGELLSYEIDNSSEQFVRFEVTNSNGITYYRDSSVIELLPNLANCPVPPTEVASKLDSQVEFDPDTGIYTYSYRYNNSASSALPIGLFLIELGESPLEITSPDFWLGDFNVFNETTKFVGWSTISAEVPIGGHQEGFTLKSRKPPGLVKYYSMGDAEVPQSITSSRNPEGLPMCPGYFFGEPNGLGKFVVGYTQGPVVEEIVTINSGEILMPVQYETRVSKNEKKLQNKKFKESEFTLDSLPHLYKYEPKILGFVASLKMENLFKKAPASSKLKFSKDSVDKLYVSIPANEISELSNVALKEIFLGPKRAHPLTRELINGNKKSLVFTFKASELGLKCNVDRVLFMETRLKGYKKFILPINFEPERCTKKHLKFESSRIK